MSLAPTTAELYENRPRATRIADSIEDSVIGIEEDQRLQREAMERQLSSQSAALDPGALHDKHSVPGAAPTATSEHERVRGESRTEEELVSYRGKPLVDAQGDEVGPISCVYIDEATGIPKWVGAQVGSLMGSQRVVVPVFGSYVFKEAISAPYARDVILDGKVASTGVITPEQDSVLYGHFGIPLSTERSRYGLPLGLNSRRLKQSDGWIHTPPAGAMVRHIGGRALDLLAKSGDAIGRPIAATRRVGKWRWPWTRAA